MKGKGSKHAPGGSNGAPAQSSHPVQGSVLVGDSCGFPQQRAVSVKDLHKTIIDPPVSKLTAARPTPEPSRQGQKEQAKFSQREKAKGVLASLDASSPASPKIHQFTSKLPKSMHYRSTREDMAERGEASNQGQYFEGRGNWTEVKAPYWWRKERQDSSALIRTNRRSDPNRGSDLFRQYTFGKCFNCLASGHRVRSCRAPTRCWRCKGIGHHASDCYRRPGVRSLKPSARATSSTGVPESTTVPPPPQLQLPSAGHRSYLEVARGRLSWRSEGQAFRRERADLRHGGHQAAPGCSGGSRSSVLARGEQPRHSALSRQQRHPLSDEPRLWRLPGDQALPRAVSCDFLKPPELGEGDQAAHHRGPWEGLQVRSLG